jgi:hypothetical protein
LIVGRKKKTSLFSSQIVKIMLNKTSVDIFLAVEDVQTARFVSKKWLTDEQFDRFHIVQLDLSSFDSVRRGAEAFNALNVPLDWLLLLGNGQIPNNYERTVDGFEVIVNVSMICNRPDTLIDCFPLARQLCKKTF